jgi:hypothetical protein
LYEIEDRKLEGVAIRKVPTPSKLLAMKKNHDARRYRIEGTDNRNLVPVASLSRFQNALKD